MKKFLRFFYRHMPASLRVKVDAYYKQLANFKILASRYGQFRTVKDMNCLDPYGKPIPWYTYPAIEYLNHLDFSEKKVFEFGSGNSSLWWIGKASSVVSVEDNEQWYKKISEKAHSHVDGFKYVLEKNKKEYVNALDADTYDIIIIDGKHRPECANHVLSLYKDSDRGEMLVFDNSDWYHESIQKIRETLNWVEVDFHGLGPINNYTWTTSVFLNPNSASKIKYAIPLKSVAGLVNNAD